MGTTVDLAKLSGRQRDILHFIMRFVAEHKFPPTIREIGDTVGISSTSVTNYNLARLEELNLLTREREVSRGLSLNWSKLFEYGIKPLESLSELASNTVRASGFMQIPVLGHIAAGQPIRVEPTDLENAEEYVQLTAGLFREQDRLFALRVKGDSMIDAGVLNGDIVILRHQETANEGDMVAAWIEGDEETTLKYFHRNGKVIRLRPANPNPEYQPIERPADRVRIKGKVVSVVRLYQ